MSTLTIGKRIVPLNQIALMEAFDRTANARLQSDRPYKARLVLIDRTSILAETEHTALATEHGFRVIAEDNVAVNPAIRYSVETFEPTNDFNPEKPYRSRLLWRDGKTTHSKLLVAEPHAALALVTNEVSIRQPASAATGKGRRRRAGRTEPKPEPA